MFYDEGKRLIKDGDVVFFKATTFKQKLITLFTGGQYSHVGIAFWIRPRAAADDVAVEMKDRLMLLESTSGGRRVIDLHSYAYRGMVVCQTPVDWALVGDSLLDGTGKVHYSYLDFIRIGAKKLFGLKNVEDEAGAEVCSEMVAKAILASGKAPAGDAMTDPDSLAHTLEFGMSTQWFEIAPTK